jgi:competence protein ComEA
MEKSAVVRRWVIGGAVVAALVLGILLPRHAGEPPGASAEGNSTVPPQLTAGDAASPSASPTPAAGVVVYVVGAVKHPAVYHLTQGTRVIDAIAKAGGSLENADLAQLNLAEPLQDAMKIEVPVKGQLLARPAAGDFSAGDFTSTGMSGRHHGSRRYSGGGAGSRHKLQEGQTLNVNAASAEELTQLPGVGRGLARRIIEYRNQNGPFQSVDDLQNVSGIGPSKFERLAPFVKI